MSKIIGEILPLDICAFNRRVNIKRDDYRMIHNQTQIRNRQVLPSAPCSATAPLIHNGFSLWVTLH